MVSLYDLSDDILVVQLDLTVSLPFWRYGVILRFQTKLTTELSDHDIKKLIECQQSSGLACHRSTQFVYDCYQYIYDMLRRSVSFLMRYHMCSDHHLILCIDVQILGFVKSSVRFMDLHAWWLQSIHASHHQFQHFVHPSRQSFNWFYGK